MQLTRDPSFVELIFGSRGNSAAETRFPRRCLPPAMVYPRTSTRVSPQSAAHSYREHLSEQPRQARFRDTTHAVK